MFKTEISVSIFQTGLLTIHVEDKYLKLSNTKVRRLDIYIFKNNKKKAKL